LRVRIAVITVITVIIGPGSRCVVGASVAVTIFVAVELAGGGVQ
jgi:hypothetical protein